MRYPLVWRVSMAAALWLLPDHFALAQATIAYRQPTEPLFAWIGQEFDLDGDGQAEFRLFDGSYIPASFFATAASGVGTARLLVTPRGPRDSGSYLVGWNAGSLIGGPTNEWLFWAAQDAPNAYGAALVLGSYIPEDVGGDLVGVGDFYGITAFMGIHFQIGSEWHYGWVRFRGGTAGIYGGVFYLAPPGWVLDWAYETRPNTPIRAGAKPVLVPLASPEVARPGYLRLKWPSEIGKAYQVQAKGNLEAFVWTNLNFVIPATATNVMLDLPMNRTAQFFRVVQAD